MAVNNVEWKRCDFIYLFIHSFIYSTIHLYFLKVKIYQWRD